MGWETAYGTVVILQVTQANIETNLASKRGAHAKIVLAFIDLAPNPNPKPFVGVNVPNKASSV